MIDGVLCLKVFGQLAVLRHSDRSRFLRDDQGNRVGLLGDAECRPVTRPPALARDVRGLR